MKLMIATDIHGSLYYAKMLVDRFCDSSADKLLLLGDLYYHGPRNALPRDYNPMQVAELLNTIASQLIVVKGNCDSEVDAMVSLFPFEDSATIAVDNITLFAIHGHKYHKDNLPCLPLGQVLVCGHYHINQIAKVDNIVVVNVGSVSIPKDNHHGYAIVDNGVISLIDLIDGTQLAKYEVEPNKNQQ